jgi:hypothetical protein
MGKKVVLLSSLGDSEPKTARHAVGILDDAFNYLKRQFVGVVLVSADKPGEASGNRQVISEALSLGRSVMEAC